MRNRPHIWKRFCFLVKGESFFIGRNHYRKSFIPCRAITLSKPGFLYIWVAPWRRVRTTQPIKGTKTGRLVANHNIQSVRAEEVLAEAHACGYPFGLSNPGKTHYVGGCGDMGEPLREERDSMVQDHTPEKPPEIDRNGPAS